MPMDGKAAAGDGVGAAVSGGEVPAQSAVPKTALEAVAAAARAADALPLEFPLPARRADAVAAAVVATWRAGRTVRPVSIIGVDVELVGLRCFACHAGGAACSNLRHKVAMGLPAVRCCWTPWKQRQAGIGRSVRNCAALCAAQCKPCILGLRGSQGCRYEHAMVLH